MEQYVSWRNGAEDFEGIQKQRSTQESHAVEGMRRRCAKMKTKDCTAARVALASNKKDPGDTNSPAEARGVARGWGEEQQDSFVGDERGKQQGGGTATTNFMNTRTILEMTFEQQQPAFRL